MSTNRNRSATTILIIGGYGNTGRLLTRLLLQHTAKDVKLIVAGRNVERADGLVEELTSYRDSRLTALQLDATDPSQLRAAFQDVTLVIVASSTARFAKTVAEAAIEAGVDYMDTQFSHAKTQILQGMESDIKDAGLCFITDCGFHPGLPAALIRYVAPQFDRLVEARVGSVIKVDWASLETMSPETMEEFAGEFMDFDTSVYKDGEWNDGGMMAMMNPLIMDFGPPFDRSQCIPMFMAEMKELPKLYPTLTSTGFYVGGLNWAVDWFISPVVVLVLKFWHTDRAKRAMGRFLYWGLRTFSSPPYRTVLKVEANGLSEDGTAVERELLVSHEDAYALTAIPVAATVLQYLSTTLSETGSIRRPGLWLQGSVVDPDTLIRDMNRMGIDIQPPLPNSVSSKIE